MKKVLLLFGLLLCVRIANATAVEITSVVSFSGGTLPSDATLSGDLLLTLGLQQGINYGGTLHFADIKVGPVGVGDQFDSSFRFIVPSICYFIDKQVFPYEHNSCRFWVGEPLEEDAPAGPFLGLVTAGTQEFPAGAFGGEVPEFFSLFFGPFRTPEGVYTGCQVGPPAYGYSSTCSGSANGQILAYETPAPCCPGLYSDPVGVGDWTVTINKVPEPSSFLLLASGLIGAGIMGFRKSRAQT